MIIFFLKFHVAGESELNEEPCIINKTESEGDFNLSNKDIPLEYRERANKSGIDCMFRIQVEDQKQVSIIGRRTH